MATNNSTQSLTVKSAEDMKNDFLNTVSNGLMQAGYSNPNTSANSYWDLIATGFAQEGAIIGYNVQIVGDQLMPDTATGSNLDRWLNFFGLQRKQATSAIGAVIASATNSTFVPQGTQLQINGLRYQVLVGGIYGNGSQITVQALDTGSQTDQPAGVFLQWIGTPTYFNSTAEVAPNYPISGGVDEEDDATARNRLSNYLSNLPGAANASQVIEWAQTSDPSVQSAAVYQAARGPATVDVTVFTYATADSQFRSINNTLFNSNVVPYITGNIPLGMDCLVTNVTSYPLDVSILLSLPQPPTSNMAPGPGGGFIDASPLQVTDGYPAIRVVDGYAISGYNAALVAYQNTASGFWVDFPVAPINGNVYNISYFSPVTLTLYSAQTTNTTFTAYSSLLSGHTTLYYVTVNTPFYNDSNTNLGIQPGDWIFPTASNTATYVATYQNYIYGMGPGERTNNSGLLPRAYRNPADSQAWPYKMDTRMIKQIIESGNEVLDGVIQYRGVYNNTATGQVPVPNGELITDSTTFQDYGSITTASDPAYAQYAPPTAYLANGTSLGNSYIFTLQNFGIYSMANS